MTNCAVGTRKCAVGQFGRLILTKIIKILVIICQILKLIMHKNNSISAGAPPQTPLEELTAQEGRGKEGRGKEGREGEKGKRKKRGKGKRLCSSNNSLKYALTQLFIIY